jgi:hypothetical protein
MAQDRSNKAQRRTSLGRLHGSHPRPPLTLVFTSIATVVSMSSSSILLLLLLLLLLDQKRPCFKGNKREGLISKCKLLILGRRHGSLLLLHRLLQFVARRHSGGKQAA